MTVRTMRRATVAFGLAFVLASSAAAVAAWSSTSAANRHAYAKFGTWASDTTPPTRTAVSIVNTTGVLGKPDIGDVITFTFSEPMKPSSILTGWNGSSTTTTIRIPTCSSVGTAQLNVDVQSSSTLTNLGSVLLGRTVCGSGSTISDHALMVMSGSTVTVTIAEAFTSATPVTNTTSVTYTWRDDAPTRPTDVAGNALAASTANRTGVEW